MTQVSRSLFHKEVEGLIPRVYIEPWLTSRRYYDGDTLVGAMVVYDDHSVRYYIWR